MTPSLFKPPPPCEEIGKEAEVKAGSSFLKQDFSPFNGVAATFYLY